MFNNAHIISFIDGQENLPNCQIREPVRQPPCLPVRLPTMAFMQREAENDVPKALIRQLRRSPSPPLTLESLASDELTSSPRSRRLSRSSEASYTSSNKAVEPTRKVTVTNWKEPQPFEVLRAVERKDIVFLMEVRDRAFHLLLRRTGDATPLLHAMRIGQSHRDVAIVLVGALSRFVNNLEDADLQAAHTKSLLKALRVNLKLAIDYGLQQSQDDLIASFMQCLIMSEGDKWIWAQTSTIGLALRTGTEGKPVQAAEQAVRKFATKELGKAASIATLDDYVANATVDLLIIAAWSIASSIIGGEPIPPYYFARDNRVYNAFVERLQNNRQAISRRLTKRLKWQLRVLEVVVEGRTQTYRRKVELLASELDEGEGV